MATAIKSAHGAKLRGIAFDDGWNGGKPAFAVRARRVVVGPQNRVGHGRRKRWFDRLRCRDAIERLAVVEPRHFDRPFDGSARAVDFEGAVGIPRDGDNAPVELGGVAGVDPQFFLAGALALLQCRIIEERQAAGPFDLQCPIGAEKNHGGMGVDPLAAPGRTEAGAIEKIEHLLLQVSLGCGDVGRSKVMAAARRRR